MSELGVLRACRRVAACALCGALIGLGSSARAEGRAESFTGTVVETHGPGLLRVKALNKSILIVFSEPKLRELHKDSVLTVIVDGEAEVNFLARDQTVIFTAEFDKGQPDKSEIEEITLFTPDESHPLGLTATTPTSDEPEKPNERSGNYFVAGRIQSIRDGLLSVRVPNEKGRETTFKMHLADNAAVTVHVSDVSFARPGDTIEVHGFTDDPVGHVSTIVAEKAEIKGVKPFISARVARAQALAKKASSRRGRKPPPSKTPPPDAEADDDEADAPAVTPAATPEATSAAVADEPEPPGKSGIVRQKGDPPPESIILIDDFSVDDSNGDEPAADAKSATNQSVGAR